jgi:hypothetical protein
MREIPDFTESELWNVKTTLKERYGEDIDLEQADAEIRPDPSQRTLTTVPVVHWSARGANFVIFKLGPERYRPQFFYRGFQQYGTGTSEYDNITECVTEVLQVQADHERTENLSGNQGSQDS